MHAKADLQVIDELGVKKTLVEWIKQHQHQSVIDGWVTIGCQEGTKQRYMLHG